MVFKRPINRFFVVCPSNTTITTAFWYFLASFYLLSADVVKLCCSAVSVAVSAVFVATGIGLTVVILSEPKKAKVKAQSASWRRIALDWGEKVLPTDDCRSTTEKCDWCVRQWRLIESKSVSLLYDASSLILLTTANAGLLGLSVCFAYYVLQIAKY